MRYRRCQVPQNSKVPPDIWYKCKRFGLTLAATCFILHRLMCTYISRTCRWGMERPCIMYYYYETKSLLPAEETSSVSGFSLHLWPDKTTMFTMSNWKPCDINILVVMQWEIPGLCVRKFPRFDIYLSSTICLVDRLSMIFSCNIIATFLDQ